jgi:hypothetical protein
MGFVEALLLGLAVYNLVFRNRAATTYLATQQKWAWWKISQDQADTMVIFTGGASLLGAVLVGIRFWPLLFSSLR